MRNLFLVPFGFAFVLAPFFLATYPQSLRASPNESFQNRDPQNELGVPTLRITTREVLVDLIALDHHNQPVLDLKPDELQVSESAESEGKKKGKRWVHRASTSAALEPITSLSIVDPNRPPSFSRPGGEPDFG